LVCLPKFERMETGIRTSAAGATQRNMPLLTQRPGRKVATERAGRGGEPQAAANLRLRRG